tara:strand:- start:57 stop:362 length:306 start_codon:yes stop_codon:yes gene_type:complete
MITFNVITGAKCGTVTNTFIFVTQLFYVLSWSWILNKICEKGYSKFSWFLFLLPIVTSGVAVSIITITTILGKDVYNLVEKEKEKEEKEDEEREIEPMVVM